MFFYKRTNSGKAIVTGHNWQVATALAVHKDGLKTGHEYD
jgi:hypothetical protein